MSKIIEKVKKLLSLSKSGNSNESSLAHEKAMQLLLKHNFNSTRSR